MATSLLSKRHHDNTIWVADSSKSGIETIRGMLGSDCFVREFRKLVDLEQALNEPASPMLLVTETKFLDGTIFDLLKGHGPLGFPFVVVSGKPTSELIEQSLDIGAHDFFVKPFHSELFRIKLTRLARQHRNQVESMLLAELDFFSLTVRMNKAKAKLTLTEFHVLLILKEKYPKGASREELHSRIWKDTKVVSKTLDVHIFKLRRKIEPLGLRIDFGADRRFAIHPL